jgi:hypothetical protein
MHCLLCVRPMNTGNISVTASYAWPVPASVAQAIGLGRTAHPFQLSPEGATYDLVQSHLYRSFSMAIVAWVSAPLQGLNR